MEFPYVEFESSRGQVHYRPCLTVVLSFGEKTFRIPNALVDTGSDVTLFPIAIARKLGIPLEDTEGTLMGGASGGSIVAFPSRRPITYTIEAAKGHRSISFKGIAYFVTEESTLLLGHHQCLEKFDLTFYGPEKRLGLLPRFRV